MTRHFSKSALDKATAIQRQAADPVVHAWVTANAGSGKTRLLTDRTARLLWQGVDPASILCVTFTKAAAGEMEERLFTTLSRWAVAEDGALSSSLSELTGLSSTAFEPEALNRARQLFARALETPGGLKIQTLHAFCEGLLRRFPVEADVPPGFQTLEDGDAHTLKTEAIDAVLTAPEHGEDVAAILAHDAHGFDAAIKTAMREEYTPEAVEAFLAQANLPTEGMDAAHLRALLSPERLQAWEAVKGDVGKYFPGVLAGLQKAARESAYPAMLEAAGAAVLTAKGKAKASSSLGNKTVLAAAPELRELADTVEDLTNRAATRRTAQVSAALFRLAVAANAHYRLAKRVRASLDYADLTQRAADLLAREDAAWVRFRLENGVTHILVDEAQDNNPQQWQIIRALTQETFAGLGAEASRNTLLAVGDAKQAIYGFQGGEAELFLSEGRHYGDVAETCGQVLRAPRLSVSFRSGASILRAVDAIGFHDQEEEDPAPSSPGPPLAPPPGPPDVRFLAPLMHESARTTEDGASFQGRVELWPLEEHRKGEEPVPFGAPLDDERRSQPHTLRLAARVADEVRRYLDEGVWVPSRGRAFLPGDVMVLLRARNPLQVPLTRALLDRGVPVAGADRLNLGKAPAVMDLLSVLRVMLDAGDDWSVAEMLRGPLVNVSEEGLQDLAWHRTTTFKAQLLGEQGALPTLSEADGQAVARARALFAELDRLAGLGPFDALARLLSAGKPRSYRARLLARFGGEGRDSLDELLRDAQGFQARHGRNLWGFLRRLEEAEETEKREFQDTGGEVRILTVHGAKGLEAPFVILPDTHRQGKKPTGVLDGERGAALWLAGGSDSDCPATQRLRTRHEARMAREEKRLFYVALTRAEDRLVVTGMLPGNRKDLPAGAWYETARSAWSTSPDFVEMEGGVLVSGDEETVADKNERGDTADTAAETRLPAWLSAPAPREVIPRPRRPSAHAEATASVHGHVSEAPGLARRRGLAIHDLLEHMRRIDTDSRPAWALRRLASLVPEVEADERHQWAEEALRIVNDPAFAHLFGAHARHEAAMRVRTPEGEPMTGRADVLVIEGERVDIVDFKTDRHPQRPIPASHAYARQMQAYRSALQAIHPAATITTALLWTVDARLEVIPPL